MKEFVVGMAFATCIGLVTFFSGYSYGLLDSIHDGVIEHNGKVYLVTPAEVK